MKRRVFCPWLNLILLLMLQNATASVVWDFGNDVKGTSVIAQKSGDINIFEKDKHVTFSVPTCMEVKYVRVEVFNHLTTPAVTYNQHTHTVIISYKLLQLSISKYTVVAKGKRSRQCGGGGGGGPGGGGGGGGGGYGGGGGGKIFTPHTPSYDYYEGGDYNQHYESYNQYSNGDHGDYAQYQNQNWKRI